MHATPRLVGLPELTGVRMLWFSGWYDGPITGLAVHDGREYWFVMVTDDDGEYWDFDPRVYILHQLPPQELADLWDAHRSFAALGIPGCMHSPPCARAGRSDGPSLSALHDRWPPEREDTYSNAPAKGWFTGRAS